MINYYQPEYCTEFDMLVREFRDIRFFQPSPDKAPWHVQAVFDMCGVDEDIVLNFWPHKMKGQRQPRPAVEGEDSLRALITEAVMDVQDVDGSYSFEVIE